ncbi:MAG: hypothetical protein WD627_12860 [Actinomycetota bacterium]
MSELDFLCPDLAQADPERGFEPLARSAMQRRFSESGGKFEAQAGWLVLTAPSTQRSAGPFVGDVSHQAKIEVRGPAPQAANDREIVAIGPDRWLVLCSGEVAGSVRASVEEPGRIVIDQTAALAGLKIEGAEAQTLMRRLTDLDLDGLPAVGAVAKVPAIVLRDGPESFRIFVPQQSSDYVCEVALDAAAVLGRGPAA